MSSIALGLTVLVGASLLFVGVMVFGWLNRRHGRARRRQG